MIDTKEQGRVYVQYLVPVNVSSKFEFFEGFGWYELKVVFVACLVGLLIYSGLGLFKKTVFIGVDNSPIESIIGEEKELVINEDGFAVKKVTLIPPMVRILTIIIPGAGAFFLVKREPSSGLSLISMVKGLREFKKRQKLYLYKYGSGREV